MGDRMCDECQLRIGDKFIRKQKVIAGLRWLNTESWTMSNGEQYIFTGIAEHLAKLYGVEKEVKEGEVDG